MPQAIWSGSLSFGLVNIPVKLYNATSPKDVRFHQLQAGSGKRVRYSRVVTEAPAESRAEPQVEPQVEQQVEAGVPPEGGDARAREVEVPFEDIVKGFEVERDRFVMVDPRELEAIAPEPSRSIDIEDFVDLREIDPVYFEKSYYLVPPASAGAEKPYWLLLRAMERAGKVAIARFVMRTKEYLAAIRPMDGVLGLETMFYADEVRGPEEIRVPPEVKLEERELDMAGRLIESLVTRWDPSRYRDTYRERVLELVEAKAAGEAFVVEHERPEAPGVPDLMAALKASVEAAKERQAEQPTPRARSRRSGAG